MRAMRAEDEFELEENGIGRPRGKELIFLGEVIVLQPELGKFCWIPGQIGGNALTALPVGVVGVIRTQVAGIFPARGM